MIHKNRGMSVIIPLFMVLQNFIDTFKGVEKLDFEIEKVYG